MNSFDEVISFQIMIVQDLISFNLILYSKSDRIRSARLSRGAKLIISNFPFDGIGIFFPAANTYLT